MNPINENFYVIAREPGAENPAIPTWASRVDNPAELAAVTTAAVIRRDIDGVPGAFQLLNLVSADECRRLVALTESLGYLADAAVSLPRSVRHNHSATWVADDVTVDRRVGEVGLNARFRFYRYAEGDFFGPHTDGSWPGSRVIDGELVANAYDDRWSQLTFLLFLSEDFEGGATRFYVDPDDHSSYVDLRTPLGGALCFAHAMPWGESRPCQGYCAD